MSNFMFDPKRHCCDCGGMGSVGQGSTCRSCGGTGNTREANEESRLEEKTDWLEEKFNEYVISGEYYKDETIKNFIYWIKKRKVLV